MKNKKWQVHPVGPASDLAILAESTEGSLLVAQLLLNRGVVSPEDAELFLSAGEALSNDPFLMNDMDSAVGRIIRSLREGEEIAVYGDYDVDGVSGTALLTQVLSHLGGCPRPYIPRRLEEGYGLNGAALSAIAAAGVKLLITVDCGTNSLAEADLARGLGMDVIVTDHHAVGPQFPSATAFLNPKRPDSTYPFRDLASVGVAFKLAQALLRRVDGLGTLREDDLLDLVALGTVADMVPLVGENRYLVKRGIEALNSTRRVGLQQMMRRAGLQPGSVGSSTIGYVLGPRLNAAGRLGDALQSYKLLITEDEQEARELAEVLEVKNAERQRMTNLAQATAREELLPIAERSPILLSSSEGYPSGIVGLVAGKLAEEFYKPAVVIHEGDEACRGSARSIPEFNMVEALSQCRDLLVQFGGHAQAAGFTIRRSDIPLFRERISAIAESALSGLELRPSVSIEAAADLSSLRGHTIGLLHRLAPFGLGNPAPIFLARRTRVLESKTVGERGDHLRLRLSDGKAAWSAIGFGLGSLARELPRFIDFAFSLEENHRNGERFLQLRVIDLRPSGE